MTQDSDTLISGCMMRLDRIQESVARLQKAHALRLSNPRGERPFNEIRLAKAAIEADCQVMKLKLAQIRNQCGTEVQRKKLERQQAAVARLSSS